MKAEFSNFVFYLKINVNITVFIVSLGKNFFDKICFTRLSRSPDNQGFSVFTVMVSQAHNKMRTAAGLPQSPGTARRGSLSGSASASL